MRVCSGREKEREKARRHRFIFFFCFEILSLALRSRSCSSSSSGSSSSRSPTTSMSVLAFSQILFQFFHSRPRPFSFYHGFMFIVNKHISYTHFFRSTFTNKRSLLHRSTSLNRKLIGQTRRGCRMTRNCFPQPRTSPLFHSMRSSLKGGGGASMISDRPGSSEAGWEPLPPLPWYRLPGRQLTAQPSASALSSQRCSRIGG